MRIPRKPQHRPGEFQVEVVGPITEQDVWNLLTEKTPHAHQPVLQKLHARHYNTARLLADGMSDADISFRTGRSLGHIQNLKADPMIQGLVEYFIANRVDGEIEDSKRFRSRMLNIGDIMLDSIEEIVERNPNEISVGERRQWVQMVADRTVAPPKAAASGILPPQQITFQIAGSKIINQAETNPPSLVQIEGTATVVKIEVEDES